MATVADIAAYIIKKQGRMSAMKLQKLVYYSQAWSLVWDDCPLFSARIEAWANGPVAPALYRRHRGMFDVGRSDIAGDPSALTKDQRETVDAVLKTYGKKSAHWLSALTHIEPPWVDARKGLEAGDRGTHEISHAAMAEYYGSLV